MECLRKVVTMQPDAYAGDIMQLATLSHPIEVRTLNKLQFIPGWMG